MNRIRPLPLLLSFLACSAAFAQSWQYTGSMATGRRIHATVLQSTGNVLVIGGLDGMGRSTATCEEWSPRTAAWTPVESMRTPRTRHTAIRLSDGRIVVLGGSNSSLSSYAVTGSIEIYDPATGHWSNGGSLRTPRMNHTSTLLANGTILTAAGFNGAWLRDCEIYDPATMTSRAAVPVTIGRMDHEAALLPNGSVMIAGGRIGGWNGTYLRSVEVYNPATDAWTSADSMEQSRISGFAVASFSDQTLLIAGGRSGPLTSGPAAELLNAGSMAWGSVSPIKVPVAWPGGAMLPADRYLMTGGMYEADWASPTGTDVTATHTCEWYDKANGDWYFAPELNLQRAEHGAVYLHQEVNPELPSDLVLVCGGITGGSSITATAEILDVTSEMIDLYKQMQGAGAPSLTERNGVQIRVHGNGGSDPAVSIQADRAVTLAAELVGADGRVVRSIPRDVYGQGSRTIRFSDLPSGAYFLRVSTPEGPIVTPVSVVR